MNRRDKRAGSAARTPAADDASGCGVDNDGTVEICFHSEGQQFTFPSMFHIRAGITENVASAQRRANELKAFLELLEAKTGCEGCE